MIDPTQQAKAKEKPQTRKSGGVYYTPTHIVDDIVGSTVGRLLETAAVSGTSHRLLPPTVRILDPACGSGCFLLGAYQYLLKWHLGRCLATDPERIIAGPNSPIRGKAGGPWRLTIGEKERLLNSIYGLDLDAQAVQAARLSLLSEMLEDEPEDVAIRHLRRLRRGCLPVLNANLKCGNALIGPDFYEGRRDPPNKDEQQRIKAFDWMDAKRGFGGVLSAGGFDAVIGNPPYVDSECMTSCLKSTREYCAARYSAASGNWDLFCVFLEKAVQLCRPGGLISFIVPNKLVSAEYASSIRRVLALDNRLLGIRDYSRVSVFPVAVYPIVFLCAKEKPGVNRAPVLYERMSAAKGGRPECVESRHLPYLRHFNTPERPWEISSDTRTSSLIEKMRRFPPLGAIATVLGAATVAEAYEIRNLIRESGDGGPKGVPVVNSGTIDRYHACWGEKRLRYLGKSYTRPVVTWRDLPRLPQRRRSQTLAPKIVVAGMTKRLECITDVDGRLLAAKSTTIVLSETDIRYVLGVLNSRAASFFYSSVFGGNTLQGGYLRIGPPQLRQVPVPPADLSSARGRSHHGQLIELVDAMLGLRRQLAPTGTDDANASVQREIDSIDRRIDRLVFELYEWSDEEIMALEASD